MNNEILPNDYRETLNLIIQKIQLAQQKAVISANITLLDLYWEIGNVILKKKKEQGWGAKVIETIGLKQICHKYIENKILKREHKNDIV